MHASLHRNSDKSQKTNLSQTTVVVGLGGIGKTQLVRKYAQVYEHEHDHIIWINTETLRYSFQQVAKKLEITTSSDDTESIVENVYHHLAADNCLFIFDNAEIDDVFDFLPCKSYDNSYPIPFILITSRNNEWVGIQADIIQLKELKLIEAIDFVKKGLEVTDDGQCQGVNDLVELLQFYPLALRQAIAYYQIEKRTRNPEFTVNHYVVRYREQEQAAKLLGFSFKGFKYGHTTITTFQLSLTKIQSNDQFGEMAMSILHIMGYLAPMSIQRESLKYLTNATENDIEGLQAAVSLLVQYCVVTSECDGEGVISVHRVVQEVIRIDVKQQHLEEEALAKTLQLLSDGFVESENTSHIGHVWKYASQCKNLVIKHYDRDISTYRYNTVDAYTTLHFLIREMKYREVDVILSTLSSSEQLMTNAIHATDKYENSPLHLAARDGHLPIVQLLIEKGADVNMRNKDGQSPLHLAVRRKNCIDLVKHLISNGADVNSVDRNGMPLVFITFCHVPYDKAHISWTKSNGKWHIKTTGPKNVISLQISDVPTPSGVIDKSDLAASLLRSLQMSHFEQAFDLIAQVIIVIEYGIELDLRIDPIDLPEVPFKTSTSRLDFASNTFSDLTKAIESFNSAMKRSDDTPTAKVWQRLKQSGSFFTFECAPKPSNMNVEKLDIVEYLIQCGAKLDDAVQNSKFNWLLWAAQNNETEIFKFFLQNGANVNSDLNGFTPLMASVEHGNVDIVKLIVDHPNVDVNFGNIMTPLHLATMKNNVHIVELLLSKNANINAVCDGQTPLTIATDQNFCEILKLFIERGGDPNDRLLIFETPLHNAAKHGDLEFVKYLIGKSANVNAQNFGKFTPLHYSVRKNNFDITKILFENGADPTVPHFNGITPMQSAGRICNIEMLKLFNVPGPESYARSENFKILTDTWSLRESEVLHGLLEKVMKNVENIQEYTNACDSDGNTPLIWAVRNGSIVAAENLLEFGADVNRRNVNKETALHYAVNSIQPEFVRLLIKSNANPRLKDRNGKTPFDLAFKMSSTNPSDQKIEEIFGLLLTLENDSKPMFRWLRERFHNLIILLPIVLAIIYLFHSL